MRVNSSFSLIDKKNARRYDDCLKYTMISGKKALIQAGLEKERNSEGYSKLDPTRVGVLVGSGMGGLTVFQDGEWAGRVYTQAEPQMYGRICMPGS